MSRDLSRRAFLGRTVGTGLGGAVLMAAPALAGVHTGSEAESQENRISGTVVVVTLVGGADGLSVVVPHQSPDYYRLRPSIAIQPPEDPHGAIPFADAWGLHPALAPLVNEAGGSALAVIAGMGLANPPRSRSHRSSIRELHQRGEDRQGRGTDLLEHNELDASTAWWFGPDQHGLFRGLARGVGGQRPSDGLARYQDAAAARRALGHAFEDSESMAGGALGALAASTRWAAVDWDSTGTPTDRGYPPGELGDGLSAIADMVRSEGALHLVAVDQQGYDTHRNQGDGAAGVLAVRLDELARCLGSFWADLGPGAEAVSVVVVSEFGRTVHENRRGGTNHGKGGVALVLDQAVRPGLHGMEEGLGLALARGSWPVTTGVHDVLAEVLWRRGWSVPEMGEHEPKAVASSGSGGSGLFPASEGVDPAV